MSVLERRSVLYCGACGMPPEYCEYGPDYESHCSPWLLRNHPDIYARLQSLRDDGSGGEKGTVTANNGSDAAVAVRPTQPWTTEERLTAFYSKYQPDKLDGISAMLEKYAGKEDKLFVALVKKYGPEPDDPFYNDDSEDEDNEEGDGIEGDMAGMSLSEKKRRRGASAKKVNKVDTRIVIQKISRNKRKAVTVVVGMDTVPDIKLKDVSKAFSKRFAGSSSVKDLQGGKKEIIIQGDHMDDVAQMLVDKFKVPADAVFLDIDGDFVPFK